MANVLKLKANKLKFISLHSNLHHPDLYYPDYLFIRTFISGPNFVHEYYLAVIFKTQSRKKPNNPLRRLLKTAYDPVLEMWKTGLIWKTSSRLYRMCQ